MDSDIDSIKEFEKLNCHEEFKDKHYLSRIQIKKRKLENKEKRKKENQYNQRKKRKQEALDMDQYIQEEYKKIDKENKIAMKEKEKEKKRKKQRIEQEQKRPRK